MLDSEAIFELAERAVGEEWREFRRDEHWRSLQPSQAGMDKDSWLAISARMVRRFNRLSGDAFSDFTISRDQREPYLGKELSEFVALIADCAEQIP
jgi:hypothetical protein